MKRKIFAAVFITAGLAVMSVPFFYHFYGSCQTKEMIRQFEQTLEQEDMEDEEKKEEKSKEDREAPVNEAEEAAFSPGDVMGLIEIEALDLKYPILEGAGSKQLACGIGHIPGTAAVGSMGNCVLAGHRGSRYGTYFKYLNRLSEGDMVKLTDKEERVYQYEVVSWEVVGAYDNSVKAQGEGTELTLLTCEDSGTMRLIYHCIYKEGSRNGKSIPAGRSGKSHCTDGICGSIR